MTGKNKNLLIRVISAVLMLPAVLYVLYLGGWYTAALLGFAAGAVAREYILITLKTISLMGWFVIAMAALMPLLPVWMPFHATALVCAGGGIVFFAAWVWHLLKGPLPEAPVRASHLMMAFIYGAGGMVALMSVRNLTEGAWWTLAALFITWGDDTAAYFFGRFLGKHKLYPEVSPAKTWEGFFGGFVGSIGFLFLEKGFFPSMTVIDCLVLGILGGILGPAGDLCESMLKRAYGVKDSGTIIPGHGGMLDRIDALIFNSPMVLLYVQFVRPLFG